MEDRRGNDEPTRETAPDVRAERRRYEAPRIERRIPVAANTLTPTSGSEGIFGGPGGEE